MRLSPSQARAKVVALEFGPKAEASAPIRSPPSKNGRFLNLMFPANRFTHRYLGLNLRNRHGQQRPLAAVRAPVELVRAAVRSRRGRG